MGLGLVVNSNVAATNTSRVLRRSTLALNKSLERLSSGLRINRAADDAAGLAIAEGFNSQVRGFRVAQRNAQDGISFVQTAEGAMSEIGNMMQRIRELAVQAATGTLSAANRTDLNAEATEIVGAATEIIARTEFNGINVFANATPIAIQTGADAGDTTNLSGSSPALTIAALSINAIDLTSVAGANTAMGNVDLGLAALNTRRAQLGAAQNRMEFTINILAIREENAMSAESAIRDADIARETTVFTRNQILVSAGTSILSQANIVPQQALQLLG